MSTVTFALWGTSVVKMLLILFWIYMISVKVGGNLILILALVKARRTLPAFSGLGRPSMPITSKQGLQVLFKSNSTGSKFAGVALSIHRCLL